MRAHKERHVVGRVGWLRAAVLGADDGIISVTSLIVGVAAADPSKVLLTGFAGLIAGAMSMAAGEYVSVSSQADTEKADLGRERRELASDPEGELQELTEIYIKRGLEAGIARQVAQQLMAKDALGAHARDELGISEAVSANPIQAALTSAITFSVGAALPVATALLAPPAMVAPAVFGASLAFLAALGALSAKVGGAGVLAPTLRVAFWGALYMAVTAAVGAIVGKTL